MRDRDRRRTARLRSRAPAPQGEPSAERTLTITAVRPAGSTIRGNGGELLRIVDGKRPQQQAVDEREDCCVRTDAERERQHRHDRYQWRRAQRSDREPYIAHRSHPTNMSTTPRIVRMSQ